MRYEDVSYDIVSEVGRILRFLDLRWNEKIQQFLGEHTRGSVPGDYSTKRDTINTPHAWIKDWTFSETQQVQKACTNVLDQFDYRTFQTESEYKDFAKTL